ncbi:MAG: HEPN domain-containing protein [Deltaproteobacteria bacterium]|nr:HEPN domain-containing protein [Deltaproteobacteria bacterium]
MTQEGFALIDYRIKQARESIQEAKVLWDQGMSNRSVMNRLYYAMFYAVLALLQEKQLGTSKHYGAISLFDREFVKSGLIDTEYSKALHTAFILRQKGDYLEEAEVSLADIEEIFPQAESFVGLVEERFLQGRE